MKLLFTLTICLGLGAFTVGAQHTELIPSAATTEFTGLKVNYDAQGNKTTEIEFQNGQAQGKINRFHTNGQLRETGYYLQGKKHGSWSSYNNQGQLMTTAHFNEGKKDGEWMVWDNQGSLRYRLTYKNGSPVGEWAMYDAHGKVSGRKVLENDSRNAQSE
jgi:antitoxin component YwqK of YwqJK toxin-antitoxin module